MLNIGDSAPDFEVTDAQGKQVKLEDFRGKKVFLWFFPKASTPGCTVEGCGLRDEYAQFRAKNIEIVGVSKDGPKRQAKFAKAQKFPFTMLCDEEGTMVQAYGAWGKKVFLGVERMGILRISYLIDEKGVVERTWSKVKTRTHATDVLAELES